MSIRCLGGSFETCVTWGRSQVFSPEHFQLIVEGIEFLPDCKWVPDNSFHKV